MALTEAQAQTRQDVEAALMTAERVVIVVQKNAAEMQEFNGDWLAEALGTIVQPAAVSHASASAIGE